MHISSTQVTQRQLVKQQKAGFGALLFMIVFVMFNTSAKGSSITIQACDNFVWHGATYTASGIYTQTVLNGGVPETDTLDLTVNYSTYNSVSQFEYGSYVWSLNGATYTTSGMFTHTVLNAAGCVQTTELNLTIGTPFSLTVLENQPISCHGNGDGSVDLVTTGDGPFSYSIDGGLFDNTSGSFFGLSAGVHTFCAKDIYGTILCESFTVYEPDPITINFITDFYVSCLGNDGALFADINGGTNLLQGYLTWWTNASGDTLNDVLTNNFAVNLENLSVGFYNIVVEDDQGCFASATGYMAPAPAIELTTSFTPIACFSGSTVVTPQVTSGFIAYPPLSYTVGGNPLSSAYSAGTYTIVATDTKGCTGTSVFSLIEPAELETSLSETACDTYTWTANAVTYTLSGLYTEVLSSINGCDSTVHLNLTIHLNSSDGDTTVTACDNYTWNGVTYTNTGNYTYTTTNNVSCTNTSTLYLTINRQSFDGNQIMHSYTPYTWNGTTYSNSGVYTFTTLNASGCVNTATLYLYIDPLQQNAKLDINQTLMNIPVSGTVATNDRVLAGTTYSLFESPANGSVMFNADGSYWYIPSNGFVGNDKIRYISCSTSPVALCDTALLTIVVVEPFANIGNTIIVQDDYGTVYNDQSLTLCVTCNDNDPNGNTIGMPVLFMQPSFGSTAVQPNGTVTYQPNSSFSGKDVFGYLVCDDGNPQACDTGWVYVSVIEPLPGSNHTFANDDAYSTLVNTILNANIALNDTDPQGDSAIYAIVTTPLHGTLTLNDNGTLNYVPDSNYTGPDQFVYSRCDNNILPVCNSATVYINVMAMMNTPLPAVLSHAYVTETDCKATVFWTTTSEKQVAYFGIERLQENNEFESIGSVQAKGESQTAQHYRFTDQKRLDKNQVYRIRIVDIDGKAAYSQFMQVSGNCQPEHEVTLYPNPANSIVNIKLHTDEQVDFQVRISDAIGRIVYQSGVSLTQETRVIQIPIDSFASGLYQATIHDGSTTRSFRFQKVIK